MSREKKPLEVKVHVLEGADIEPSGRVWLSRFARLVLEVSCSGSSNNRRTASFKGRALEVVLRTGPAALYRRFPFNCNIGIGPNSKTARILEFSEELQQRTFTVPIGDDGSAQLTITSELAGVPNEVGLSDDERSLALMARFSVVQRAPDTFATGDAEPSRPWVQTVRPLVGELPRPIFVVGMYRSGTSILTWAIGQHPNIWALEETGFLPILTNGVLASWTKASGARMSFAEVYEIYPGQYPAYFGQSIDGLMRSVAREHAARVLLSRANGHAADFVGQLQVLRALGSSKGRWADGTPENAMTIGQLVQLFPAAKFVHIVRNPVSVAASMARFDRIGGERADPSAAVEAWRQRVGIAYLAERAYGSDVVKRVRYEELIDQPARLMREIFAFLEEPAFDAAANAFEVRLNSSKVTSEELDEARESIAPDRLADLLDLYEQASAPLARSLAPDPGARRELDDLVRDQVMRLAQLYA
jgi:hypothetical protein